MTFNQINYFLTIAKHLNFTQAASELFVAQSTLSRSMAALEAEIGVKLLQRDFHNVTLTAAGELMYCEMEKIMAEIGIVVHRVQAVANNEDNKLTIGILAGQEVDSSVLFALKKLSDDFPDFDLEIRKMLHQELVDELKANKLDIAETVISVDDVFDDEIGCLVIERSNIYLAARTDDLLWKKSPTISDIDGRVLLVPPDYHMGAVSIPQLIKNAQVNALLKVTSDMESQSLWVEAGMGVTLCNKRHVICSSKNLKPIAVAQMNELPEVCIALLWNKNCHPPILDSMLNYLQLDLEHPSDISHD